MGSRKKRGRGQGKGGNSTRSRVASPPRPANRPSVRTDELVDYILTELIGGQLLGVLLRPPNMPHRATFWRWRQDDPELDRRYWAAMKASAEARAERPIEAAEDLDLDPRTAANIIRANLAYAGKLDPQRYGDRLEHAVGEATGKTLADLVVAARAARARP